MEQEAEDVTLYRLCRFGIRSLYQFRYISRKLDAKATSFRFGVDFAVGDNWAVGASKKVRGGSLTSLSLAEDGDAPQGFDVCVHKRYHRFCHG